MDRRKPEEEIPEVVEGVVPEEPAGLELPSPIPEPAPAAPVPEFESIEPKVVARSPRQPEPEPIPEKESLRGVIEGEVGNKKDYDPRSWLAKARGNMASRVVQACEDLKSAGKSLGR